MENRVSHLATLFIPISEEQRVAVSCPVYYDEPLNEKATKCFKLEA